MRRTEGLAENLMDVVIQLLIIPNSGSAGFPTHLHMCRLLRVLAEGFPKKRNHQKGK